MSDKDFLNIGSEPEKGIKSRTIHTIITITQYPNGNEYITKSLSWIDKKNKPAKKKEKKEPVKAKTVKLEKPEVY